MYVALYNENIGLGGFKCMLPDEFDPSKPCGRVTRTERGMRAHCWRTHGKKVQAQFEFPEPVPPVGREGGADGGADSGRTTRGDNGVEGTVGSSASSDGAQHSDMPEVRDARRSE